LSAARRSIARPERRRHRHEKRDMFRWFTKTNGSTPPAVQMVHSLTLVTAVSETVADYYQRAKRGEITIPAYQRTGAGIAEIWEGTRIEALRHLWGFGKSDPALLADHHRQMTLLKYVI